MFDVREVAVISPGETKEVNLDFKDFPLKNRLCGTVGYFIAMSNVSISDLDGISGNFIFKYPIDRDSIESVAVTLVSNVSVIGTYYSPDKVLRNYYPVNDIFILDKVVTSKEDLSKNFHKNFFMEYRPGERFACSDLVLKYNSEHGLSWDFETRSISSKM